MALVKTEWNMDIKRLNRCRRELGRVKRAGWHLQELNHIKTKPSYPWTIQKNIVARFWYFRYVDVSQARCQARLGRTNHEAIAMQVVLVMFRSDGGRKSFSVTRDIVVVGRREDCDLRIPLGEVSRKHCRFVKDGDALRVEDLGSSNGTFLNGERVQESAVNPGDTVQVGPVMFVVQVDGAPAEDEMRPTARPTPEAPSEAATLAPATTGDDIAEGEFDPMAALESADQSGFEFTLDENADASPEDSSQVDLEESQADQKG